MTNHSLMTICKYCLVDTYKVTFSKGCPSKEEIVTAILKHFPDLKELPDDTALQAFYDLEARSYENLSLSKKKRIRHVNRVLINNNRKPAKHKVVVSPLPMISEGSSVIPKRVKKEKYINCSPLEEDLPF